MKKMKPIKIIVTAMAIITAIVAIAYLTTRTPASEGALRIESGGQVQKFPLDRLALTPVHGTVRNGKGEVRTVDAQGILLSHVLVEAGITEFTGVTVTADDEYSAAVTAEEVAAQDMVWLILQDEGGMQLIVFGDKNSKRNVSDVVRLSVQ